LYIELDNLSVKVHFNLIDSISERHPVMLYSEENDVVVNIPKKNINEESIAHRLVLTLFKRKMPLFTERLNSLTVKCYEEPGENILLAYLAESLMHCNVESYLQNHLGYWVLSEYYRHLDDGKRKLVDPDDDLMMSPEVSVVGVFMIVYALDSSYAKKQIRKIRKLNNSTAAMCEAVTSIIEKNGGFDTEERLLACFDDLAEIFKKYKEPQD